MAHKIVSFGTALKLERFLNGYVTGGKSLTNPEGVMIGLHGLTLIIDVGAGNKTVTFSDATGAGLPLALGATSIRSQIQNTTGLAALLVSYDEGKIVFGHASNAVTVVGTGTANALFGFSNDDQAGTVYNPPGGVAPRVLSVGASPRADSYYAHLEIV